MSILIVCAPDEGARAFGRELGAQTNCRYFPMEEADEAALCGAEAIVLVLPDYYTHACWQMKSWLSGCIDLLHHHLWTRRWGRAGHANHRQPAFRRAMPGVPVRRPVQRWPHSPGRLRRTAGNGPEPGRIYWQIVTGNPGALGSI